MLKKETTKKKSGLPGIGCWYNLKCCRTQAASTKLPRNIHKKVQKENLLAGGKNILIPWDTKSLRSIGSSNPFLKWTAENKNC